MGRRIIIDSAGAQEEHRSRSIPGAVAQDLDDESARRVQALLRIQARIPEISEEFRNLTRESAEAFAHLPD